MGIGEVLDLDPRDPVEQQCLSGRPPPARLAGIAVWLEALPVVLGQSQERCQVFLVEHVVNNVAEVVNVEGRFAQDAGSELSGHAVEGL